MAVAKIDALRRELEGYGSCLVAYSGGVDSAFLAKVAHDVLGDRMLAAIADSPSLPRDELREAVDLAEKFSIPLRIIQTHEFENPSYTSNPPNRCYFCKHELFTQLVPLAQELHLSVIVYGENASDVGDFRPGSVAASEFDIRAPLKNVGFTKPEIREMSRQLGLPTSEKPQLPCTSSRVPYGEPVTLDKLRMIEAAEAVLHREGFREVRVRHHELKAGCLARIEVGSEDLSRMIGDETRLRVDDSLRAIGYQLVTVDLRGYRRGSLNFSVQPSAKVGEVK